MSPPDLATILSLSQGSRAPGVLLLSGAFISTPHTMEGLHLLLERSRQGSPAPLVPVLCNLTAQEVMVAVKEYKAAANDAGKQQWATDLEEIVQDAINIDQASVRQVHTSAPLAVHESVVCVW
jgi:hypothetical protein